MANEIRVVASYAKNDYILVKDIIEQIFNTRVFQHKKTKYKISVWYDESLAPSENWDTEIKWKFIEADVVIFFLSHSFFKSTYITNFEIKEALKRHEQSEISLLLIVLENCDYDNSILAEFEMAPKKFSRIKPIKEFHHRTPYIEYLKEAVKISAILAFHRDYGNKEVRNIYLDIKAFRTYHTHQFSERIQKLRAPKKKKSRSKPKKVTLKIKIKKVFSRILK